jgi:hypothetical protein
MRGTFSIRELTIRSVRILGCGAALVMAFFNAHAAAAADPPAKPARPPASDAPKKPAQPALDDALLQDLDNELLEGAGALKNRPAPNSGKAGPTGEKRPAQATDGEDVGVSKQDDDPLFHISQEMRSAESLIPEHAKRLDAEQLQRRVIEDLARLIEQAEQQSAQQQSSSKDKKAQQTQKRQSVQQPKSAGAGGSKNSNQPAKDSSERLGKSEAARPDPEMIKGLLKASWGNLPAKDREQMLQNPPERFLPQYELLIERYYRRLAEEQNSK